MEDSKKQLVDKIKTANNVLITVSTSPSVDQLSAAIGLTLALNKLKKHATTVFSGDVPSTIEFLQPEDTIETNTDSLRDFIISLDKAKADKIRYKVEDTMVKIFITPYKTSISDQDLVFSQGDFNVDVVVALGVQSREDLDQAITTHGRILHDATVATVNTTETSEMGAINWMDTKASSLCEMITGVIEEVKENILDEQMATALLTGIVAETERFSNEKTSSSTMSASATLMAAGANQQLVATKLETEAEETDDSPDDDEPTQVSDDKQVSIDEDGSLRITHDQTEHDNPESEKPEMTLPELPDMGDSFEVSQDEPEPEEKAEPEAEEVDKTSDEESSKMEAPTPVITESRLGSHHRRIIADEPKQEEPAEQPQVEPARPVMPQRSRFVSEPPTTGGPLNSTVNRGGDETPILSTPTQTTPLLKRDAETQVQAQPSVTVEPPAPEPVVVETPTPAEEEPKPEPQTLSDIERAVVSPHQAAEGGLDDRTLQDIENVVEETQKKTNQVAEEEKPAVEQAPAPDVPDLSALAEDTSASEAAIRERIDQALANSADANGPAMEPIAALGAAGRVDIAHNEPAEKTMVSPPSEEPAEKSAPDAPPQPSSGIAIGPDGTVSFPENLVSSNADLPKDQTAAPEGSTAPPPVPPPMTMPLPSSSSSANGA